MLTHLWCSLYVGENSANFNEENYFKYYKGVESDIKFLTK